MTYSLIKKNCMYLWCDMYIEQPPTLNLYDWNEKVSNNIKYLVPETYQICHTTSNEMTTSNNTHGKQCRN